MARKVKEKVFRYTAVFDPQPEGGYTVTVPALPGCVTEGETLEEARRMAKDAILCYIESLAKHGGVVPDDVSAKHRPVIEKIAVAVA